MVDSINHQAFICNVMHPPSLQSTDRVHVSEHLMPSLPHGHLPLVLQLPSAGLNAESNTEKPYESNALFMLGTQNVDKALMKGL